MEIEESQLLTTEVPEGALPGQFCRNHMATKENPNGTDCSVWIFEGKSAVTGIYKCPYLSAEHARQGTKFLGVEPHPGADGVCRDFEPRDFGPDSDWKIR